jgi:hypothetical protein
MSGQLTTVRLPRARTVWSRSAFTHRIERRRQRAAEREYRLMVARGHRPREFETPFYRDVPRRRF